MKKTKLTDERQVELINELMDKIVAWITDHNAELTPLDVLEVVGGAVASLYVRSAQALEADDPRGFAANLLAQLSQMVLNDKTPLQ